MKTTIIVKALLCHHTLYYVTMTYNEESNRLLHSSVILNFKQSNYILVWIFLIHSLKSANFHGHKNIQRSTIYLSCDSDLTEIYAARHQDVPVDRTPQSTRCTITSSSYVVYQRYRIKHLRIFAYAGNLRQLRRAFWTHRNHVRPHQRRSGERIFIQKIDLASIGGS